MMLNKSMRSSSLVAVLIAFCAVVSPHTARAALLDYTFMGTIFEGTLDLGGGDIVLDDKTFTVTGMTLDDTDVDPVDGVGRYEAMSIYTFEGVIGSFVMDATTDEFYVQDCGFTTIGCVLLSGGPGDTTTSPEISFSPAEASDPDLGGVPIAWSIPLAELPILTPRMLTNADGHTLEFGSHGVTSLVATAKAVPDVGSTGLLLLLGTGMLGLARRFQHNP